MKKIHIIGIIIIAVAIGAIVSSLAESSTYGDFTEAFESPGTEIHVVGKLNKDKELLYDPQTNPDVFGFYMIDNEGVEKQVKLLKSKPQDFEKSEQIVLIGKADGDAFVAREILMKCPSKYEDGQGKVEMKETANN